MDTGKNLEITNEIFKQLGLNGPGSVSLESSQPTPGQSDGDRDQQKGRDAGKRRQKGKKTSAGRSEDLAWVLKEARIEQSLEKRGGEYKPSPEILKYLEGENGLMKVLTIPFPSLQVNTFSLWLRGVSSSREPVGSVV